MSVCSCQLLSRANADEGDSVDLPIDPRTHRQTTARKCYRANPLASNTLVCLFENSVCILTHEQSLRYYVQHLLGSSRNSPDAKMAEKLIYLSSVRLGSPSSLPSPVTSPSEACGTRSEKCRWFQSLSHQRWFRSLPQHSHLHLRRNSNVQQCFPIRRLCSCQWAPYQS